MDECMLHVCVGVCTIVAKAVVHVCVCVCLSSLDHRTVCVFWLRLG